MWIVQTPKKLYCLTFLHFLSPLSPGNPIIGIDHLHIFHYFITLTLMPVLTTSTSIPPNYIPFFYSHVYRPPCLWHGFPVRYIAILVEAMLIFKLVKKKFREAFFLPRRERRRPLSSPMMSESTLIDRRVVKPGGVPPEGDEPTGHKDESQ